MQQQLSLFDLIPQPIQLVEEPETESECNCEVSRPYLTSYCNQPHCLGCGLPLEHGCFDLDPDWLKLEYDGIGIDFSEILDLAEPRYPKVNTERRTLRQWFVPRKIAQTMAALAEIYCQSSTRFTRGRDVLEPTCGAGMLLAVCAAPDQGHLIGLDVAPQPNWADLKKYGIEFYDTSAWGWLGSLAFDSARADELDIPARYDVIMCHPPFGRGVSGSDKGTGLMRKLTLWARTQTHLRNVFQADVYSIFIGHFLQFLKPGGVMIALSPSGWMQQTSFQKMRESFLFNKRGISFIASVDLKNITLWKDAKVHCAISVFRNGPPQEEIVFAIPKKEDLDILPAILLNELMPRPDWLKER